MVVSIDGSEPAPGAGSVMQKHERIVPGGERPQPALLLRGVATASSRCMLPSSGANDVERDRPERRIAGLLERDRAADVTEREAAVFAGDMRRQQAGRARPVDQFAAQLLGRPVRRAARVRFERNDFVGDERADARLQRLQIGGKREVDCHGQMSKNTVSCGPCRWMSKR